MKKEALVIFIIVLLILMPFSQAQINSIEIKDVNINESQIQILIQNNLNQDFNKETFIINNQQQVIQEELLSNFTAKFFIVNYQGGIKLNNLQVIIDNNEAKYDFTGNEDKFILNQAVSQTSELTQVESNSPVSYIYSAGRVAKIQDGNIIYFSSDNVGSTSLQTDNLGNIKTKSNYLPFGKELSFSSQGKEKYGFTSKEYDIESSLNYFNARYYNPSNGKFISNDPIFKPTEGGYQYVNNNPLTITDPSGKQVAATLEEFNQACNGASCMPPPFGPIAKGLGYAALGIATAITAYEAYQTLTASVEAPPTTVPVRPVSADKEGNSPWLTDPEIDNILKDVVGTQDPLPTQNWGNKDPIPIPTPTDINRGKECYYVCIDNIQASQSLLNVLNEGESWKLGTKYNEIPPPYEFIIHPVYYRPSAKSLVRNSEIKRKYNEKKYPGRGNRIVSAFRLTPEAANRIVWYPPIGEPPSPPHPHYIKTLTIHDIRPEDRHAFSDLLMGKGGYVPP